MLLRIIKSQSGFGFFGMMVIVIFMAVAGSFVMVAMTANVSNQAMQETLKKMDVLEKALKKYRVDAGPTTASYGSPPSTLAGLLSDVDALGACTASYGTSKMLNWCGPYLQNTLTNDSTDYSVDGWGTTFYYSRSGTSATLRSWGPNKVDNAGGGDDITRTF